VEPEDEPDDWAATLNENVVARVTASAATSGRSFMAGLLGD
jgi:hypothetical protein